MRIQKHTEKKNAFLSQKRMQLKENDSVSHATLMKSDKIDNNIAVFAYEDEKLSKRVRNLFDNVKDFLDVSEETKESVINSVIKTISKRTKSFDQLYDDTMKFITKHLKDAEVKSKFIKKFRKLIRILQEEQIEELNKLDGNALNIKIDLNENEEKREEKNKLEQIRKDLKNFVENQKVPDVYLDYNEYSIEPNLKKKIYQFIVGLRDEMTIATKVQEKNDLMDLV